MKTAEEIRTEPNPFFREIWDAGYDFIVDDPINEVIKLCRKSDEYIKVIPRRGYPQSQFRIKGSTHQWLCESDGSADRFRQLIKPDFYIL